MKWVSITFIKQAISIIKSLLQKIKAEDPLVYCYTGQYFKKEYMINKDKCKRKEKQESSRRSFGLVLRSVWPQKYCFPKVQTEKPNRTVLNSE
jgi:hypothetical protein